MGISAQMVRAYGHSMPKTRERMHLFEDAYVTTAVRKKRRWCYAEDPVHTLSQIDHIGCTGVPLGGAPEIVVVPNRKGGELQSHEKILGWHPVHLNAR